jgi:uncharacterized membrane protein
MPDSPLHRAGLLDFCGVLCHQVAARSPQFDGQVFPLCHRCTGLYFGFVAAFAYLAATGGFRRRMPDVRTALTVAGMMVPLTVDGAGNALHLWDTPGWLRAATGIGVGTALPMLLVPLAAGAPEAPSPSVARPASMLWPAAVAAQLVFLVAHPGWTAVFDGLAVVAVLGPAALAITLALALWNNRADLFGARRVRPIGPEWLL